MNPTAADTSSPRSMLKSFIDACNELHQLIQNEHYLDSNNPQHIAVQTRILDCIDASELPAFERKERAAEAAICLKEILDRHQLPSWDEIPDTAEIESAGGLEKFSFWRIPGTRITIARVEEGPQKHEYLFSTGTVDRAADYFSDVQASPYRTDGPLTSPNLYKWYMSTPHNPFVAAVVRRLPDSMRFGRTLNLTNWKWPALLVALLITVAFMTLVYRWHLAITQRTRGRRNLAYCMTIVFPVAAMIVPLLFEWYARDYLTIRGTPLYIVSFFANATATLAGIVVVFAASNRVAETVIASPRVNRQGLNAQLIRIGSKLTSLVLAVIVMMVGGQYLGIPVGTLLASAGIGGLALALGAQDTLKTLFGTLMLMADKPFRVGERIVFKGYDGVVEDIGLRSTRIRLLSSHQVTIPNDELARSDIENVGRRQCIKRVIDIHIPLDTPSEKVEAAVAILREQLDNHEGMNPDYPPRVYFVDFLPTAFTIRAIYWYHPPNYWDYLAFGETFNLAVFHAFEDQGISFSLPNRITHTSLNSEQAPLDVRMVDNSRGS
ncbi:Low conductance mechanosensitive channel YnaI [Symmachiella dynata]|uniref:mechanosensitive ion channel family protein n=1 Tax=Symmachiella dynata TaxID=2527995 RepID=UPI00118CC55D|nr:mechanosensitive ion channel family protein [Symmachiella dynata]QDT48955.1 Low conductance mechanosensitive channel YnaI [Symmachiella dynata]